MPNKYSIYNEIKKKIFISNLHLFIVWFTEYIVSHLRCAENLTSYPVCPVFQLANTNKIKRYKRSNESRKPVVIYCVDTLYVYVYALKTVFDDFR